MTDQTHRGAAIPYNGAVRTVATVPAARPGAGARGAQAAALRATSPSFTRHERQQILRKTAEILRVGSRKGRVRAPLPSRRSRVSVPLLKGLVSRGRPRACDVYSLAGQLAIQRRRRQTYALRYHAAGQGAAQDLTIPRATPVREAVISAITLASITRSTWCQPQDRRPAIATNNRVVLSNPRSSRLLTALALWPTLTKRACRRRCCPIVTGNPPHHGAMP